MPRYKVTVEVKARSAQEARALVTKRRNPDSGSTFEITTFLIRKLGARMIRIGIVGDWENPSIYQLPDGRSVYLVENDWKFEGSSGTGFRSLKARLDEEVAEREMQAYRAQETLKEKTRSKDQGSIETFMQGARAIHAGMERAGASPRFEVREDPSSIAIKFGSGTYVEYDKRTKGFSATAVNKTVSGWKGMRDRLAKYGEYE
jgi:hypothetical protein